MHGVWAVHCVWGLAPHSISERRSAADVRSVAARASAAASASAAARADSSAADSFFDTARRVFS